MLQHFGNFRVILRVDLAGRSRAKILQLQRQSQFLVHVFSQNRKLHRADFQYLLMKTFQIKVFAKEGDRKSTRLNSSHIEESRMPSSA